jgi:vWA-MoxR associated protein middle region (VMAP-M) 1/Trypsin-like peptidase domain
MEFEDGKPAIACIYSATGEIVGTGFLVSKCYILTCAHVVNALVDLAGGANPIGQTVSVGFPFTEGNQPCPAHIIFYRFEGESYREDCALLQLETVVAAVPISLTPLVRTENPALKVFGFSRGDSAGRNLTAVLAGEVAGGGGWEQIEDIKQPGLGIEDGFSGAPVWSDALKAFVGMVVARDRRRPEAKVGFMIPTQKLGDPLRFIMQETLLALLEPQQQVLAEPITIAYGVCRPVDRLTPPKTQLKQRLEDLSVMGNGGLAEPMLVQFAACLLNQKLADSIHQELAIWAKRYTDNLDALRVHLQDKQKAKPSVQSTQPAVPCLLVSVKAHEVKAKHSSVSAWLISDANHYDATTG